MSPPLVLRQEETATRVFLGAALGALVLLFVLVDGVAAQSAAKAMAARLSKPSPPARPAIGV